MANTIKNNQTNKTLIDYTKSNIDVHINWLLFLNTFKSISNKKGFMEVAPLLEEIRSKAYEAFSDENIINNTNVVDYQIVNVIGKLLDDYDITDVKEHIGENISKDDIINLSTAIFIRRKLENFQITATSNNSDLQFILAIIKRLKKEQIKSNIIANGYSSDLLGYYLESLRIGCSEESTLQNYIYHIIELTKGIELMANKLTGNEDNVINESVELIIYQLFACNHIESIYDVDSIFDQITCILDRLTKDDIVALKKQV